MPMTKKRLEQIKYAVVNNADLPEDSRDVRRELTAEVDRLLRKVERLKKQKAWAKAAGERAHNEIQKEKVRMEKKFERLRPFSGGAKP